MTDAYTIVTKTVPTFYFIGVTTTHSSIMKVFPRWMAALGRPEVVIEGVDLQLHDSAENYRQIVSQIKHDPPFPRRTRHYPQARSVRRSERSV